MGIRKTINDLVAQYFPGTNRVSYALAGNTPIGLDPESDLLIPVTYSSGRQNPSTNEKNDFWSHLSQAERRILLCREVLYNGDSSALRQAILGTDYQTHLHFVFESPQQGIDALTALDTFESAKKVKMNLEYIPRSVLGDITPILELSNGQKKERFVGYFLHALPDSGIK